MSSSDRFLRLRAIFDEVSELEPQLRAAALDRLAGDDAPLRAEVESLLAESGNEFSPVMTAAGLNALDQAYSSGSGGKPDTGDDPALPILKGAYSIVRKLGEGGMGIVYEAEQAFPRRRVAVKSIRPGLATKSMLRRFRNEAELLARLAHPGIAQIYEAGFAKEESADQAFFVMELVEGLPLNEYARREELSPRQRIELLARICHAVEHAHQRGVIHRDLKPGNILVTPQGQPKILDFGVARATEPSLNATMATQHGQLIGTPAYMSPEQIRGDPTMDTRADIYALGVIAFELLSGELPFDLTGIPLTDAASRICEGPVRQLSLSDRSLRSDAGLVVASAMHRDRERRYASAGAFADDLERLYSNRPISARRDSAIYVLRKVATRHLVAVSLIATILLLTVVFAIASSFMALRNARLAHEAEDARANADHESARLRQALYGSKLGHALASISSGDGSRAIQLLSSCPEELRGWEWRLLDRICDQALRTIPLKRERASGALSADGKTYYAGSGEGSIRVVDLDSGQTVRTITESATVTSLSLIANGEMLAALERRDKISFYSPLTGRKLGEVEPPKDPTDISGRGKGQKPSNAIVRAVGFPRSARILFYTSDGLLFVGDADKLSTTVVPHAPAQCFAAAVSHDECHVIVSLSTSVIVVIELASGKTVASYDLGTKSSISLASSPTESRVAIGTFQGDVSVWDWSRPEQNPSRLTHHDGRAFEVTFSPDGRFVGSSGGDRILRISSLESGRVLNEQYGEPTSISDISFMPDSQRVLVLSQSGNLRIHATIPEPSIPEIRLPTSVVFSLAMMPEANEVIVGASNGMIYRSTIVGAPAYSLFSSSFGNFRGLTPTPSGEFFIASDGGRGDFCTQDTLAVKHQLRNLPKPVTMVEGDCFQRYAITWSFPNEIAVVDTSTREVIYRFSNPEKLARVAFGHDQTIALASASVVRFVSLNGTPRYPDLHVDGKINAIALSASGSLLALGLESGDFVLFQLGQQHRIIGRHAGAGALLSLVFIDRDTRIAGGGGDHFVHIWSADSGEELLTLPGHHGQVTRVTATPDSKTLVSIDTSGYIRVWSSIRSTEPLPNVPPRPETPDN